MQLYEMERLLRNIDARVTRIAQLLPTIPTRQELNEAVATAISRLPTKDDLRNGLSLLASPETPREDGSRHDVMSMASSGRLENEKERRASGGT